MAYSNTRLSTYKRCRLKYYWQYITKEKQSPAVALHRGKAAHKAMATYYEEGNIEYAIADAWSTYNPSDSASLEGMLKLDAILDCYFKYAVANDKWKVIEVEHTVEVEYGGVKLMGIWDLLVEKQGKRFIVDHKFQKSHSFSNLEVDSQVSHYLALAKLAGVQVDGLMYNIVNLEPNTNTPAFRQIVARTDLFLDAYLQSLLPQIQEIRLMDANDLPVYQNWTSDCCWQCSYYRKCIDTPFTQKSV